MLVLTRRPDQGIRIGKDVRIVVLGVSGDQVRIGLEAPQRTPILRDEVFLRVARANGEAVDRAGLEAPHVVRGETLHFDGIPGFPEARRFVLRVHDRGEGVAWLVCLDDSSLVLPVVDLRELEPDVADQLSADELAAVGAEEAKEVELLGVVNARTSPPRLNLHAPMLVNPTNRRAVQLVREAPLRMGSERP